MFAARGGFFSTVTAPSNLVGWITYFDANTTFLGGNIVSDGTNNYWTCTTDSGSDIQIISLDANGNVNWQKNYKPSYLSTDNAGSILIDITNSALYVCGNTDHSSSNTSNDGLLFKSDLNGNITWQKQIGNASSGSNTFNDALFDMVWNNNKSHIFACGYANGTTPLITKYDTSGNLILQKTGNVNFTNGLTNIACDSTDNIYVAYQDGIIKLDSNINFLYSKANTGFSQVLAVTVDSNDNVYFFPDLANSDTTIFKYDSTGNLVYEKTLGNVTSVQSATTDINDNLYIVGATNISGNVVGYLAKLNSSGTIQWQYEIQANVAGGVGVNPAGITNYGNYVYVYGRNTANSAQDQFAMKVPITGLTTGTYGNIVIATCNVTTTTTSTTISNTAYSYSNSTWATSNSNLAAANTSFTFTNYTI